MDPFHDEKSWRRAERVRNVYYEALKTQTGGLRQRQISAMKQALWNADHVYETEIDLFETAKAFFP